MAVNWTDAGSFFTDLAASRQDMKARGTEARMNADDGVTPEIGKVYTVSPCFAHGDRSWIDDFWEVIEASGPNLLVKIHEGHGRKHVSLFRADERAWYPADAAFALWQNEVTE